MRKAAENCLPDLNGGTFCFSTKDGEWMRLPIEVFDFIKHKIGKYVRVLREDLPNINTEGFSVNSVHIVYYNVDNKLEHRFAVLLERKDSKQI